MYATNGPYKILAKGRRNYLNELYKFVIRFFPQRNLQFSQAQQLKQDLPQLPLIEMLFMDLYITK
jgi:hypothetical protein